MLEHFDEQCFIYFDEPTNKFYDADGNQISPLSINSVEDLEVEAPELLAKKLDSGAEKQPSLAPSRTQSAIVKNWRPKSSKGYGLNSRNEGKLVSKTTTGAHEDQDKKAGSGTEGVEETRDTDAASEAPKSRTGRSKVSHASAKKSEAKTYISNLEANLDIERRARKQLEEEIEQMK